MKKKFFLFLAAAMCCVQMSGRTTDEGYEPCDAFDVPWLETFTRDATGAVAPDCWTISSATPQVWVVAQKTYDSDYNATVVQGQAYLYAAGGGPRTAQVFALPPFNAVINTLEVAFDYKTSLTTANCGQLEVGYMTDPTDAASFVSLTTYPRTLSYVHKIVTLENVPATAGFIAFRFAGGTSDLCAVSMDNFVVAAIGHSSEVDPSQEIVPDPSIWALTYCEAQFTWYSYTASAFAIGLANEHGTLIAGIAATTEECDRFAQSDGIGFPEYDDYQNHYYCSTKWILNVDEEGQQRGAAWDSTVINIGTAISPQLGLRPGTYQVMVYELNTTDSGYTTGALLATIPFTLVEKKVENLQVAVAADNATATLTWDAPALSQGERLYIRVWAGENVAYDNFSTKERPSSPLVVDVIEGMSYTAIVQVVDKNNNPLGSEVEIGFTVGVNNYEPANPHAEVAGGDNVTFSWNVAAQADAYEIVLFWNGEYYTTLTVHDTTKMTTMPKDGTWTWTVQAYNKGTNGKYFPASNAIEGNSFVSKAADIPEDAIVMNVWGMEAGYLDQYVDSFPENKFGWMVMFATGEEGGTGMPMPYFLIYTTQENAISGVYNTTRGNIDLESCYINTNNTQAGCIMATDAEVRLQFVAYDDDKAAQGPYRYGYYTGQFRLVGTDGKTYVGKFMEQFCNSFNYSTAGASIRDHKGMWDEDPDYIAPQGIESVQDAGTGVQKLLINGQLIIEIDGVRYNVLGTRIQ